MTRTARASHRAKERERSAWIPDDPRERERCPDTFDLEAFLRAKEAAADRQSTNPAARPE